MTDPRDANLMQCESFDQIVCASVSSFPSPVAAGQSERTHCQIAGAADEHPLALFDELSDDLAQSLRLSRSGRSVYQSYIERLLQDEASCFALRIVQCGVEPGRLFSLCLVEAGLCEAKECRYESIVR